MTIEKVFERILQILYSFLILNFFMLLFKKFNIGSNMINLYSDILIYILIGNFILGVVWILMNNRCKVSEKLENLILMLVFNFVSMFIFFFLTKDGKSFKPLKIIFFDLIHSLALNFSFFFLIYIYNLCDKNFLLIVALFVFLSTLLSFWDLLKFSTLKLTYKFIWAILILLLPYLGAPIYYYLIQSDK
ncbi:MAG: hypothetical protein ACP5Q5_02310 [Brevinematia bacterium]